MWLPFLVLVTGLVFLFWSSGRFVWSSAALSKHFNLSPLIVGIIVMGFATSAPELLTSIIAAIHQIPKLAVGNAYGSNISNIGLCVGVAALVRPIKIHFSRLRKDFVFLAVITILSFVFLLNYYFSQLEALVLVVIFIGYLIWKVLQVKNHANDTVVEEVELEKNIALSKIIIWLSVSFIILLVSADRVIWAATTIAEHFGVSEMVVGLTVVAIGTSLPELAATISSVKQGHYDLAIGNIIGSNIFNTLAAIGVTGLITPIQLSKIVVFRDVAFMTFLTMAFLLFCASKKEHGIINRVEGLALVILYIGYLLCLIFFNH